MLLLLRNMCSHKHKLLHVGEENSKPLFLGLISRNVPGAVTILTHTHKSQIK